MTAFKQDVPVPTHVSTEEEAWDLLHLLLKKRELYPEEAFGFDTETTGKKVELGKGKSNPLDWMGDYVILWSLSARMDRDIEKDWYAYVSKWHPEQFIDGAGYQSELDVYGRWSVPGEFLHIFVALLEDPRTILATWNGKYDGHVCWNSGINIWNARVRDLLIAGYLYNENLQGRMSLKDRAEDWCGYTMVKFKDLFASVTLRDGTKPKEYETDLRVLISEGHADRVSDYASYDAFATLKLHEFLEEKLGAEILIGCDNFNEWCERYDREAKTGDPDLEIGPMWPYFVNIECPMTEVLWRMERRGMDINLARLEEVGPIIETEVEKLKREVNHDLGFILNINSPAQLVKYFFDPENKRGLQLEPMKMTKGGKTEPQPSVDVDVLTQLADDGYEVAAKILRIRKLTKMKGTYVDNLREMAKYFQDHRIHPSFNQYGARTGRFSTDNPNSQNFPRPKGDEFGIRKMFVAPPGRKLIVSDYEQLEMRIMAHMSGDRRMIKAIQDGMDLHCYTVSVMYNVPYDDVTAAKKAVDEEKKTKVPATDRQKLLVDYRQAAKAIGFGLIYGAGPKKIAAELKITKEEAKEKINGYFKTFPGVKEYIDVTLSNGKAMGFVTTLVGRRRRLDQINHSHFVERGHAEREAVNVTIQGTAADIVKYAMISIEMSPVLNEYGVGMINQIHDELVLEVPEEHVDVVSPIVRGMMEKPFRGKPALCVPTPVDLKVVNSWAEAK